MTNPDCSDASVSQYQPVSEIISEQVSEHSQDQLPTSLDFSNTLISREISTLKEELRTIKVDIASIHNKSLVNFPPNTEVRFGHMLKNIKDEISLLHTRFDEVLATSQIPSSQASSFSTTASNLDPHDLTISTWNCRGLLNAKPYLHKLVMEGSDVIVLNEHWLWPFQLKSLCDIHPDYQGYGVSDHRLNESSTLTCGCGGVGVIWKKSLQVSPITNVQSDRLCAIRISLSESLCVNVICAYLPSSDHCNDDFRTYVNDLASLISALESSGPTIILGDLNAHLNDAIPDIRAQILLDVIHNYDLCIMSLSSISTGPGYTFFSGNSRTTLDYILANTCISHRIAKCYTHGHHELNFSDHLPLSVVLSASQVPETTTTAMSSKINWKKAVHDDLISLYSSEVSNSILPLLSSTSKSADGLNTRSSRHATYSPMLLPHIFPPFALVRLSLISTIPNYVFCVNAVEKYGSNGSLLAVHVRVNCTKINVTQRKQSVGLSLRTVQKWRGLKSSPVICSSRRTATTGSSPRPPNRSVGA